MKTIYLGVLISLISCSSLPPTLRTEKGLPVGFTYRLSAVDQRKILEWADLRYGDWIAKKAGLYPESKLRKVAESYSIIVYPGYRVPGDGKRKDYNGFCWYGSHIEVAINWDVNGFYDGFGLAILGHEWDHALLGDFHPEEDFHGPY